MTDDKNAVLWTTENCPLCVKAEETLKAKGYSIEKKSADDLITGAERDLDAMAQLAIQSMSLPLVCLNGTYINPGDLDK